MPLIRSTWFFRQLGYGWTESLWLDGPSIDSPVVFAAADRYAQKRIKMSGAQTFLTGYRLSVEGVFRDARSGGYGTALAGQTGKNSDAPQVAVLCLMRHLQPNASRLCYLRGIWDEIVHEGGNLVPGGDWIARFDDWRTVVQNDGWGWLGVTGRTITDITAVLANANGTVSITTDPAISPGPFPMNATVRIAGAQGSTQINGSQIVSITSATTVTTRRRIAIFPWLTGGRVTLVSKGLLTAEVSGYRRVVERKVGRPSYLSRGRRPARAAS